MEEYLTVAQVAELKGVSLKAVYKAISEGRLTSTQILGRLGIKLTDAKAWIPRAHTVRRKNSPVSEETKQRISRAQKLRWALRHNLTKGQEDTSSTPNEESISPTTDTDG